MFKRIKRKFTILATASMFALMVLVILIMNGVNLTSVIRESDEILDMISQPGAPFFEPQLQIKQIADFMPRGMSVEVPYESRYFSVVASSDGEILMSNLDKIISVDEDSVQEFVDNVLSKNRERGFVGSFRYKLTNDSHGYLITFLDCGRRFDTFLTFLTISVAAGLFGCLVVFLLFMLGSKIILKPIAESYEKQKRFISDAGHEIRTPLTVIKANIDLLEGTASDGEELQDIRLQTERLTQLTNDLVLLSRMDEPGRPVDMADFPVSDLVRETANSFRAVASVRNMEYNVRIQPGLSINGSPDGIRKLVSILLDNALKYSSDGGTINLELVPERKGISLTVENTTAEEIKEEDLRHVFERFYRTDSSRNSETGGHGIGLSIAKAIVENHKGTISATTEKGHDFKVAVFIQ